ncbi:MAG: hypothetical protein PHX51_06875 [Clostridia bacterium]|nr:hypothetical protein [Clostridia bacterium]
MKRENVFLIGIICGICSIAAGFIVLFAARNYNVSGFLMCLGLVLLIVFSILMAKRRKANKEAGIPSKPVNKKRIVIIAVSALLVLAIGGTIWGVTATQWERDFKVTYKEYNSEGKYKLYEIENKTNKTFDSVYLVFKVKTWQGKSFTYKEIAALSMEAGEVEEFKLYSRRIQEFLDEQEEGLQYWSAEIVRIKYKR